MFDEGPALHGSGLGAHDGFGFSLRYGPRILLGETPGLPCCDLGFVAEALLQRCADAGLIHILTDKDQLVLPVAEHRVPARLNGLLVFDEGGVADALAEGQGGDWSVDWLAGEQRGA